MGRKEKEMRISSTLMQAGGNFARPTKYSMILTVPVPIRNIYGESLDVLCKNIQAPGIINESYEIKIKGQTLKIPGRTQQTQEITIVFYVDEKYKIRKLFQDWILGLDNRNPVKRSNGNASIINTRDFYGELELIGRDFAETTNKPVSFRFENVFPISIGELEFDSTNKDSLSEISVTFAYSRYNTFNELSNDLLDDIDSNINQLKG